MSKTLLIIRFSSFGDILQTMSVLRPLKESNPDLKIHWLTKSEYRELVELSPLVDKVWTFEKGQGAFGLIKLAFRIRSMKFDYIYDAHNNLRSKIAVTILNPFSLKDGFFKRPKNRIKRFLLFSFGINKFENPFRGMISYTRPIDKITEQKNLDCRHKFNFAESITCSVDEITQGEQDFITMAPSAAWEMKRWPTEHWIELISKLPEKKIFLLGGPSDQFIEELRKKCSTQNVVNLSGKLSLTQSVYLVSKSSCLISADTGLIHAAEIMGINGISLIGPTAFGFPTHENIKTLEVEMECRPCTKDGRGKCSQDVWRQCMVDITPTKVSEVCKELI